MRGFTILEIIIAIAIIGIVMGLSIPLIKNLDPGLKLSSAASELVGNLRLAQQMAISQQIKYGVKLLPPLSYELIKVESSTTTIKTVLLKEGVTIESIISIADNTIVYNPIGEPSSSGMINLSKDKKESKIEIKPSGYVRIQK